MAFDVYAIREEFPILQRKIDGHPLVYLDNAATTQKPKAMLDAIYNYYVTNNSNVHRGAHLLADEATKMFEASRATVANFINAASSSEVIWTSGTTESINIVANGAKQLLQPGDEVLVTEMEHHANLVTWQQVCKIAGARLVVTPIKDNGELDIQAFESNLSSATKMVAMPHVSNALGTINPIASLIASAKKVGAWVLIDGAQGIAHEKVDVQALGCDFYVFSGHKLFGPTGVGVLWGKADILDDWPVWQTGGEMIKEVTYQSATWGELPNRLEAGTPNIAGAIGMAAGIDWFRALDFEAVQQHERSLMDAAMKQAEAFDGLIVKGNAPNKIGVLSFVIEGTHPADIGFLLDKQGVAIRTGDHCAQPLMDRMAVPGTARASFSVYTTLEEIDALFSALRKVKTMLL